MYFITCTQKLELSSDGFPDFGASHVTGYYSQYEWAEDAVLHNSGNMYEYLYEYAVIEHIPEGIYSACQKRTFFKYDAEKQGYIPIEEPSFMKHFTNIALG